MATTSDEDGERAADRGLQDDQPDHQAHSRVGAERGDAFAHLGDEGRVVASTVGRVRS